LSDQISDTHSEIVKILFKKPHLERKLLL
jgi:hypothetical protein